MSRISQRLPIILALAAAIGCALAAPAGALDIGTEADGGVYESAGIDAGVYLGQVKSLDLDFERVALRWGRIAQGCGAPVTIKERRTPDADCYDWKELDRAVDTVDRSIVFTAREVPCWVFDNDAATCPGEAAGSPYVGATPAEREHFAAEAAAFHHAVAVRYDGHHGHRAVHDWTVWNEPNGTTFWSESPKSSAASDQPSDLAARGCHFAFVYRRVVDAIRDAQPGARTRIGFASMAPTHDPSGYLAAALAARTTPGDADTEQCEPEDATGDDTKPVLTKADIDAVAIHLYPATNSSDPNAECTPRDPSTRSLQCVDKVPVDLDEHDATRGTPIWVLETAYESRSPVQLDGLPPLVQALRIGQVMARLSRQERVAKASWYSLVDGGCTCDWESGFVGSDYKSRKPSFLAAQAPVSVQDLGGGRVRAWMHAHGEPGEQLMFSTSCRHDAALPVSHYGFTSLHDDAKRGVTLRRSKGSIWAEFGPLVPAGPTRGEELRGFCLAARTPTPDGRPTIAAGAIVSADRVDDGWVPYFVAARRVRNAQIDPVGDTIRLGMDGGPAFVSAQGGYVRAASGAVQAADQYAKAAISGVLHPASRLTVQEGDAPGAQYTEWSGDTLRVWFDPASSGSFDLGLDVATAPSWDDVRLPSVDDEPGWSTAVAGEAIRLRARGDAPLQHYEFAPGAEQVGRLRVSAASTADWSFDQLVEFRPDDKPPTGAEITKAERRGGSIEMTVEPGRDTGSGVASRVVQQRACGAGGPWVSAGSLGTRRTQRIPEEGRCVHYRLVVADNVGNTDVSRTRTIRSA